MRWHKLHNSPEFQLVYKKGKRYDSRFVTAFILPNALGYDRFGLTASRKAAKNAVDRNRMKRLLRETIRLAVESQLKDRQVHYDWVLNAKRSLLSTKLATVCVEFQQIIAGVDKDRRIAGAAGIEAGTSHQPQSL